MVEFDVLNKHLPDYDYVHLGHRTVVAVTAMNTSIEFLQIYIE